MRNFQDTFETHKRSFINAFCVCMTVPLIIFHMEISLREDLFYLHFPSLDFPTNCSENNEAKQTCCSLWTLETEVFI